MSLNKLLSPVTIGSVAPENRVVMAPLTRNRAAQPGDVPGAMNVRYYEQRAGAGLIVTEGTQISRHGQGYFATADIYTDEQEAGWAEVVKTVHAKGGKMSLQLWHVGRVSHRLVHENMQVPVAPSAIRAENTAVFVKHGDGSFGMVPADEPRALDAAELPVILRQYVEAAKRARRAGFDMVEVHAANGYLLHQFLATGTNLWTDAYGGSVEKRARFVVEVVEAVAGVFGADRVGVRVSPNFVAFGMSDSEAQASTLHLATHLERLGIAYIHIAEPDWVGGEALSDDFRAELRAIYGGKIIVAGNYTPETAEERLEKGQADAIAFGRPFLANPDLVERFRPGGPLNTPDAATFFGGGEAGYTNYPTLDSALVSPE